jgi:hypothetical protein
MVLLSHHKKFQTTLRRKQYKLHHPSCDLDVTTLSNLEVVLVGRSENYPLLCHLD